MRFILSLEELQALVVEDMRAWSGCSIVHFVKAGCWGAILSLTMTVACRQVTTHKAGSPSSAGLFLQANAQLLAEQLEAAGLPAEASAEALRALPGASASELPRYLALLGRVRDFEFSRHVSLGEQLSQRGLQDDARREYVLAAQGAVTPEQRDRAIGAADRTQRLALVDRHSMDRIWSALRTIIESGAAALAATAALIVIWLSLFQPFLASLKRHRQRRSRQVVIADFQDGTTTGLGKGLPTLIRALYEEQREFEAPSPGGAVLVLFQVAGGLPLLSAPAEEADFSWAGLSVGGLPVEDVLSRWSKAWHAPWSTTTGTIYRLGGDVRVGVSIATHGERPVAWDASLAKGVNPPRDFAYRVLFTILAQWERRDA